MRILLALLLLVAPLAADITLAQQIRRAEPGDFMVTLQGRTYTLLLVQSVQENSITFEEIALPRRRGGGPGCPWSRWVEQGAPGNTSWTTFTVDTNTSQVLSTYSYSQRKWLSSGCDPFLPTLLTLQFQEVPEANRRRTGSGALWRPPLAYQGMQTRDIPFNAYTAKWPRDSSSLSGRQLTIYIPAREGAWPDYFPYWIDVSDHKIRVVDTGTGLKSPAQPVSCT